MEEKKETLLTSWVQMAGRWQLEGPTATYLSPDPKLSMKYAFVLGAVRFHRGTITAKVTLREGCDAARILFGYDPSSGAYYTVGLGGYGRAYVLTEYIPNLAWNALKVEGTKDNLVLDTPYDLKIWLKGQSISLSVNGVEVFRDRLASPPAGDQIGLFAWGDGSATFEQVIATPIHPRAFVVMQFGNMFDSIYTDVIKPCAEKVGIEAYRADDVYKPGIILQDIIRGIVESEVIIAEITPANANVFYELGYAHCLGKPTILLAERDVQLPFDISGYRCIFYDNTIRGKAGVENDLTQHLKNIFELE